MTTYLYIQVNVRLSLRAKSERESSKDNYLILAETIDDDKTHTAEAICGDSFSMQIIQVILVHAPHLLAVVINEL